jgi:hypothetical protein
VKQDCATACYICGTSGEHTRWSGSLHSKQLGHALRLHMASDPGDHSCMMSSHLLVARHRAAFYAAFLMCLYASSNVRCLLVSMLRASQSRGRRIRKFTRMMKMVDDVCLSVHGKLASLGQLLPPMPQGRTCSIALSVHTLGQHVTP